MPANARSVAGRTANLRNLFIASPKLPPVSMFLELANAVLSRPDRPRVGNEGLSELRPPTILVVAR